MNNNRVFYIENRSATHKLTFGLPGFGISSIMEKEIATVANNTKDDNIVVIDIYGKQFKEVVNNLGGVVITVKELFSSFNEIVFGSLQESESESYYETFNILVAILDDLGRGYIYPYQQSILYKALDDMRKSNDSNTIGNFIKYLQQNDAEMASILEILNTLPNFENNQDIMNKLNSRFVYFDLGDCQKDFKNLVYLLALKMTKDKMWENGNKRIYTCLFSQIDHAVLTEGFCNYLSDFYKRTRMHWGITSFYINSFSVFINNPMLASLLNNTNEFVFLKQDSCDINKLSLYFDIPNEYLHFLAHVSAGQGIWTNGRQHDYVNYIHDFINEKQEIR